MGLLQDRAFRVVPTRHKLYISFQDYVPQHSMDSLELAEAGTFPPWKWAEVAVKLYPAHFPSLLPLVSTDIRREHLPLASMSGRHPEEPDNQTGPTRTPRRR